MIVCFWALWASAASPVADGALDWAASPAFERAVVEAWGPQAVVLHSEPADLGHRDRLWVQYVKWLEAEGYIVGRPGRGAPWQHVRWQRFESEDGALELQIRRAGDAGWRVFLIPKSPGSLW